MTRPRSRLMLLVLFGLLASLACSWPVLTLPAPTTGVLDVEIDYSGDFYYEIFDYSRDAVNIRHYVLILPEEMASRGDPGWIFTSLDIQPDGTLGVRDGREEYAWALPYIFDAPRGFYTYEMEPGNYVIAAAFVAGPVTREDIGAGDDAILWPGITGGGASTDFRTVTVAPGETTRITFAMTDKDGWACPWLYVFDGTRFERRTEVLRNLRGPQHELTETTPIGAVKVVDGAVIVRLAEEKDEVSYIDSFALVTSAGMIAAEADTETMAKLASDDGNYLVLRKGEAVELRFPAPVGLADGSSVAVVVDGYYVPQG